MMRRLLSLPIVAVVLVAAGCGGDSSSQQSSTASRTSPSPAPITTTSAASTAAPDRELASSALLRLEDFPSGWTASDDGSGTSAAACEQIKTAKAETSARATSPDFKNGDTTQVSHNVYIYADEAAAERNYTALTSQAARVCMGKSIGKAAKKDPTIEFRVADVTTAQLNITPVGEDSSGARLTVPVSTQGIDVDISLDLVVVRQGRAISLETFTEVLTQFDDDLRGDLVGAAARRLKATLDS